MYRPQNRVYCNEYHKSYIDVNFTSHLRSLGHDNNVRKNRCTSSDTNSMIEDIDPDILVDKLRVIYEKNYTFIPKRERIGLKMIIDDFSRTKSITQKQFNKLCIKFNLYSTPESAFSFISIFSFIIERTQRLFSYLL